MDEKGIEERILIIEIEKILIGIWRKLVVRKVESEGKEKGREIRKRGEIGEFKRRIMIGRILGKDEKRI